MLCLCVIFKINDVDMKRILLIISGIIVLLAAVVLFRTFTFESKQTDVVPYTKMAIDDLAARRLSEAIQIKTISYDDSVKQSYVEILKLHDFLTKEFPFVDSLIEKEIINQYSLLYHWKGTNPNLQPAMILAHLDVVPVEAGKWDFPPFAGLIKDGYIHGRGSLDDKLSVLGILEAAEKLLLEGFFPERSWYFAFGHDEEISGRQGAFKIVDYLEARGIHAGFILDEGLVVTEGMVPGIDDPVALIGISEKGYMTIELSVEEAGGHSSMPAPENAITILSNAIDNLTESPFEAEISEPVGLFLEHIGPEASFTLRMASANRWLFEQLVIGTYKASPAGNALVSTTIAPTIFKSGIKENYIPTEARAIVNLRLLPGITFDDIIAHFNKVIDDNRVNIKTTGYPKQASPVASLQNNGYQTIEKTIRQIFPDAIVAPSLVLATTDSRHYTSISENIYKFLPVQLTSKDIDGIHGVNEKLSIEGYKNCIRFYYQLIKNGDVLSELQD